jgi:hypothetical protein
LDRAWRALRKAGGGNRRYLNAAMAPAVPFGRGQVARQKIVHSRERILGKARLWGAEAATPPPT